MTAIVIQQALGYPATSSYDETITLAAGVAAVRVFDCGFGINVDVRGENTGSNPINTVGVELSTVSDTNSEYQHQTAAESAIGSVAAGSPFSWNNNGDPSRFVRITLTSTLGTTVQLQARAL